jgi:hypothetical protein
VANARLAEHLGSTKHLTVRSTFVPYRTVRSTYVLLVLPLSMTNRRIRKVGSGAD